MEPQSKEVLDRILGNVETIVTNQKTFATEQKTLATNQKAIQNQVDAIDLSLATRLTSGSHHEDLLQKALNDSDELKRIIGNGKGSAVIRINDWNAIPMQKSILTGGNMSGTAGVIMPERVGGIVPQATRRLFLRDLLYKGTRTTGNAVYFVRESTYVDGTSMQAGEGAPKGETTTTFATVSRPVQTIATYINISRQALDDMETLSAYISGRLLYSLRFKEEQQCVSGDGTGANLTGLLSVAAPFDTSLLTGASHTPLDTLRRALEQVEKSDEVPAGFFILNPTDVANIDLLKDTLGRFIVSDPGGAAVGVSLWGKPVVSSNAIQAGTFLAGSSESAELIDRMDATVEVSFQHADNWTHNVATLLAEERTVLCVYRPAAFVTGSLTSSPA